MLGVPVIGVSVIPEGNSLGRTMFAGSINTTAFQVIAAGGACETPFGHAEGYGSDMAQVYGLSFAGNGYTADAAIGHARALLGSISSDVRHRIAEIIASMGELSGTGLIEKVIEIASFEARFNITSALSEQAERIKELRSKIHTPEYESSIAKGERSVIETVAGMVILIKVTTDENGKEHRLCTYCNGKDGHKIACPLYKDITEENDGTLIFSEETSKEKD